MVRAYTGKEVSFMVDIKLYHSHDVIFQFLLKLFKGKNKESERNKLTLHKNDCQFEVTFPCRDCHDNIRLNLAGLTDNLNFKLMKSKNQHVEVHTPCAAEKGEIEQVGIDYIELTNEKKQNLIILKDKINYIHLLDKEKKDHIDKK
jgi:hypothetical protein